MRAIVFLVLFLASHASAQPYPQHVAAAIRESLSCPAGRASKTIDSFVLTGDFNGDGVADYLIDSNAVPCPDLSMCGSAGCSSTAFISGSRGHLPVPIGNVRGMKIIRSQSSRDLLSVSVHGSACGRAGASDCARVLEWNGRAFAAARDGAAPQAGRPSSGWQLENRRGAPVAVGKARSGGWRVSVACMRGGRLMVEFILKPRYGFDGNAALLAGIDGGRISVIGDGAGDYGLSIHGDGQFEGMPRAFVTQMMQGRVFALDGPATVRVPADNRSFALTGAGPPLEAVLRACPAAQ